MNVDSSTVLWDGEIEYGSVEATNRTRRYEVYANTTGTLDVVLVPCAGKVQLEISSNRTHANETETYSLTTTPDGKIAGTVDNALGKYYLTVTNLASDKKLKASAYEVSSRLFPHG